MTLCARALLSMRHRKATAPGPNRHYSEPLVWMSAAHDEHLNPVLDVQSSEDAYEASKHMYSTAAEYSDACDAVLKVAVRNALRSLPSVDRIKAKNEGCNLVADMKRLAAAREARALADTLLSGDKEVDYDTISEHLRRIEICVHRAHAM